jgi:hypothetical protein
MAQVLLLVTTIILPQSRQNHQLVMEQRVTLEQMEPKQSVVRTKTLEKIQTQEVIDE